MALLAGRGSTPGMDRDPSMAHAQVGARSIRGRRDAVSYNRRSDVPVESAAGEAIKEALREQIGAAQVAVCLISPTASLDAWIAWELQTAKAAQKGLVGILLDEHAQHPAAMVDSGAMFVPFKRDAVEVAIDWVLAERHTSDDFTLQDD